MQRFCISEGAYFLFSRKKATGAGTGQEERQDIQVIQSTYPISNLLRIFAMAQNQT
jgi:hypothetical protein